MFHFPLGSLLPALPSYCCCFSSLALPSCCHLSSPSLSSCMHSPPHPRLLSSFNGVYLRIFMYKSSPLSTTSLDFFEGTTHSLNTSINSSSGLTYEIQPIQPWWLRFFLGGTQTLGISINPSMEQNFWNSNHCLPLSPIFYYQGKFISIRVTPVVNWSKFFLDDGIEQGGTVMSDYGMGFIMDFKSDL